MNLLDFLNSSPQYSIFQKETNKTNFGGILFILYIIIMIFISLAYIVDFSFNEKYEIETYIIDTYLDMESDLDGDPYGIIESNPNINPYVDFTVLVALNYPDFDNNKTINLSEIIDNLFLKYKGKYMKGKLTECGSTCIKFDLKKEVVNSEKIGTIYNYAQLVYKCNDTAHLNYPENIFSALFVGTKNFKINHNSSIPISTYECNIYDSDSDSNVCNYREGGDIHDNETLELGTLVSSIVYEEKKGISRLFDKIMNKTNKYIISYIETEKSSFEYKPDFGYEYEYDEESENYNPVKDYEEEWEEDDWNEDDVEEDIYEEELSVYKHLAVIHTYPVSKYQIYRRREISFLTVLANIGALFSTFYSVFSFIFKFYSKNFDNYKIVDKILQLELTNNKKNIIQKKMNIQNKNIELSELKFEKDNIVSPLIDTFADNDTDKEEDNKNKDDSSNKLIEEKEEDGENNEKIISKENKDKILPKLSFFDFYFNNIYFKCCKRRKKQEILELCNAIKLKYISIDLVLYNLIRLESLFKDYKWNNSELNSLENNELIKELIKLI